MMAEIEARHQKDLKPDLKTRIVCMSITALSDRAHVLTSMSQLQIDLLHLWSP